MAHQRILSFCAMGVLFWTLACRLIQAPALTPAPLGLSTSTLARVPTVTLAPTHTLVQTSAPRTATAHPPSLATEGIGPFQHVTSLPDLLSDSSGDVQVRALADGSVWIIMSQAVLRWDGQTWDVLLSETDYLLAAVDDGGRLWVLGQDTSEIAAWQDGQWTTYDASSGWTEASISEPSWWAPSPWRAYMDAAEALWLPMRGDLRLFDGDQWSIYTLEDMGFSVPEWDEMEVIHRLAMREGGAEVWVGECYYSGPGPMGGQGVRWFDRKTWHGADAPVGDICVSAIEVDLAGNVWLGAADVVWWYEPAAQTWTPFYMPEALRLGYNFSHTRQLIVDGSGDVWVIMLLCGGASCSGPTQLYRIHEGEWSLMVDSQDGSMPLEQLALDGNGDGWLFWDGTVYRLDGESMKTVASMAARGVGVSPDGRVWVVANDEVNASLWILEP